MTKKEMDMYKSAAKRACKENGIKVLIKNMVLLETGFDGVMVDYVMFEDLATGKQYQCYWGAKHYNPELDTLWAVEQYIA